MDNPTEEQFDGSPLSVGIVAARFNPRMVDGLIINCTKALLENGVDEDFIEIVRVPGSNEIPYAATLMAKSAEYDVVICLGLVFAGETPHHEVIAQSTGFALQQIAMTFEVPIINGIVVVQTEEQAEARCHGSINRGREFGLAGLEMGLVGRDMTEDLHLFDDPEMNQAFLEEAEAFLKGTDNLDALYEDEDMDDEDLEDDSPWGGKPDKDNPWKL